MADFKNARVYKADKDGHTRGARLGVADLTGPAGDALKAHIEASEDTSGVFEHEGRFYNWDTGADEYPAGNPRREREV